MTEDEAALREALLAIGMTPESWNRRYNEAHDAHVGVCAYIANMVNTPTTFDTELSDLDLSSRTDGCLARAGIFTIGNLASSTERDLLRIPHFGRKSLSEVKRLLAERDLYLGMRDVPPPIVLRRKTTDASAWKTEALRLQQQLRRVRRALAATVKAADLL